MELSGIPKNGTFALIVIAWLRVAVIGGISFYEHRSWPRSPWPSPPR